MPRDSKSLLQSLIRAENGDREGVRELLRYFCEAVDVEKQPDRAVMEFMADRFRMILDGVKADKAFGFTGNQGRPGGGGLERDFLLALNMVHRMNAGSTKEDAIAAIVESDNVSESTINRAWLKNKNNIDDNDITAYEKLTKDQVQKI
jgi:hypothetical protein